MYIPGFRAALALVLLPLAAGCGRSGGSGPATSAQALDRVLAPSNLTASLQQAGGGHYRATARFRVDTAQAEAAGGKPASPPVVTTTTELWMDRDGGFRLVETNDQDGGREIVRAGSELAVALRHGKLVRRPAKDAESSRYLAEAVGAPFAAWDLVRRQATVEGGPALRFRRSEKPAAPAAAAGSAWLRAWRDTVVVKSLEGQATLDAKGALPVAFDCKATFEATRDGVPVVGEVAVTAALDQLGQVPTVAMPAAETVPTRQRTVLEERALLGGLGPGSAGEGGKPPR